MSASYRCLLIGIPKNVLELNRFNTVAIGGAGTPCESVRRCGCHLSAAH